MTEKRFQSSVFRETVIALPILLGCIEVKAEEPYFFCQSYILWKIYRSLLNNLTTHFSSLSVEELILSCPSVEWVLIFIDHHDRSDWLINGFVKFSITWKILIIKSLLNFVNFLRCRHIKINKERIESWPRNEYLNAIVKRNVIYRKNHPCWP